MSPKKLTRKQIPKFRSREEEAKFWDSHDLADYWDEFNPVRVSLHQREAMEDELVFKFDQSDSPHRRSVHSVLDAACLDCQTEAVLTEMALLYHIEEHPGFEDGCYVCDQILATEASRINVGETARAGVASHREDIHPVSKADCVLCQAIDVLEAPRSGGELTRRLYFRAALAHSLVHPEIDEGCGECLDISSLLCIMAGTHTREEHAKSVYGCYLCMRIAGSRRELEGPLEAIPAEHRGAHAEYQRDCALCVAIRAYESGGVSP